MRKLFYSLLILLCCNINNLKAQYQPQFSTAGFYQVDNTGRSVYSMNPAWRFHKGNIANAEKIGFDDTNWDVVSLPNGIEYLPTEASGCINYQGEIWYRKHFNVDNKLKGKKIFLHFEAIMGKSKVYVNGKLLKEHFGGYLPVIVDATEYINWNKENIVAVWADNSDDPSFPPGKPQASLDYTYFGGIYRDCWLVAHNNVHITDANYENEIAGGGIFVSYDKVSDKSAQINIKAHLRNESKSSFIGVLEYVLQKADGSQAAMLNDKVNIKAGKALYCNNKIILNNPQLWSPDSPTLYNLFVYIRNKDGQIIDGYRKRIGIRSVEFKGKDGFWLNGKPYGMPLIGANRHQDFAIVGNAVPNSIHWRDAKKLRDAGLKVIRNAHCPQDPAFMDACDELGLFVIDNTPGWQFWNDEPIFAQRVYSDIRNLVRRDRNHASIWLWEPILNETWYPADFAKKTKSIVEEEYPYPYCYSGCDTQARGSENYDILFTHPSNSDGRWAIKKLDPKKTYFTREWGDNVDDWSSHNSPSRVNRVWGENAMLVQAQHYAKPDYPYTCYDALYRTTPQHVGGCLWHSFDHQRGYHPDPFYGGLMDVFRQPKYSYEMFKSQRPPIKENRLYETGPMVYIAHKMTPFSSKDVTVYSNCDEVRLTFNNGGKTYTYKKDKNAEGMPSPIITFKNAYNFMDDKAFAMKHKGENVYLLAEGLMDGKVVATHKVMPSRRPEKIMLWLDNEKTDLLADGSDIITVVAAVTDKNGNIKRLNNYYIKFHVEGEGRIIGGADILANPAPIKWGTAPILVQSTLKPGKIKVIASVLFEGSQMPTSAVLEFESKPAANKLIYDETEASKISSSSESTIKSSLKNDEEIEKEHQQKLENRKKLKEVEKQQAEFGESL